MSREFTLQAGQTFKFPLETGGIVSIMTTVLQNAVASIMYHPYGNIGAHIVQIESLYAAGNIDDTNKFACWRDDNGCYIKNNWGSAFLFKYSIQVF